MPKTTTKRKYTKKQKDNYKELFKRPEWQKLRLKIFKRDKFKCQRCGSKENNLQVHHKIYIVGNKPWEYPNYYLITLCDKCHKYETRNYKMYLDRLIQKLRREYLSDDLCELYDKI